MKKSVSLPEDEKNKTPYSDDMQMTPFERGLVHQEKLDRATAKAKYTLGIQGVDGCGYGVMR